MLALLQRQLRKERDLTLCAPAERAEVSVSTLSQIEKELISPSIATLERVCNGLCCTLLPSYAHSANGIGGHHDRNGDNVCGAIGFRRARKSCSVLLQGMNARYNPGQGSSLLSVLVCWYALKITQKNWCLRAENYPGD